MMDSVPTGFHPSKPSKAFGKDALIWSLLFCFFLSATLVIIVSLLNLGPWGPKGPMSPPEAFLGPLGPKGPPRGTGGLRGSPQSPPEAPGSLFGLRIWASRRRSGNGVQLYLFSPTNSSKFATWPDF